MSSSWTHCLHGPSTIAWQQFALSLGIDCGCLAPYFRCRHKPLACLLRSGHDSLQQASQLLVRPDVRHHLSKLLYAEEWAKSIQESHPVSEARSATVANHWNDVSKIKEALQNVQNKLLPVMQNRKLYDEVMGGKPTAWF